MKKLFISALWAVLFTLSGVCCFATGTEIVSIGQIELADYVIMAGIAVFIIGAVFIILALCLKPSQKKIEVSDEEYDEEYDDINILYEDEEAIAYPSDEEDFEDGPDADDEAEDNEPAIEASFDEEAVPEETEACVEPEIAEEEIVEEETVYETEETDEDAADEPTAEDEPDEETEEPEEEPVVKSIRLTLSGTNNPDLKMIDIFDSITAGRRSTNDLLISDNAVSGEHCKFTYDGEVLFIEDLNSTNGTFLNGEQVEKAEVKSGDTIILGQKQYRITIS